MYLPVSFAARHVNKIHLLLLLVLHLLQTPTPPRIAKSESPCLPIAFPPVPSPSLSSSSCSCSGKRCKKSAPDTRRCIPTKRSLRSPSSRLLA
ncbi:hypothetical protein HDK77DRAFT_169563 [Phyllosticta capitalensis]|uniref:uncharacterized protein n=1 Tax=Phyllosticta capitalensis TaxID=121624 RepID=UPI00313295DE